MVVARNLGTAWNWLERGDKFDLVVIDLALDRLIREFEPEFSTIKKRLSLQGLDDLPMSGQALGMRLWGRRKTLKQPYCYVTNNVPLWLANMGGGDPEFAGGALADLAELVIDKSSLWPHNVAAVLTKAREYWEREQWLA